MIESIALIRPNHNSNFMTPPLGIGYLSSYIKKHGCHALVIDALRDNLNEEHILNILNKNGINVAGITCLSLYYEEVVKLSLYLKSNGIKVIIGGVHPTFMPYQTLSDSKADYVICGEGEIPLLDLLNNNMDNHGGGGIKGVYSLKDLHGADTPYSRADIVHNLDDLPFPDWEQMDPNSYPPAPHGIFANNYPIGIIMSSRGCSHACKFCASAQFYERKVRFRSPENVVTEMCYLKDKFGVKEFQFEDDNLILGKKHAEKICNLIIEKELNTEWACPNGIRADMVDESLIKLMKKAGCYLTALGIESANDEILKIINKRESVETMRKAIDIITRNGIKCVGFFIMGLPGETKETIENSINFALDTRLDRASFVMFSVMPGCEFWDELKWQFKSGASYHDMCRGVEYVPEGLTKNYLAKAIKRAHHRFYMRPKILLNIIPTIKFKQMKYLLKRVLEYGLVFRKRYHD